MMLRNLINSALALPSSSMAFINRSIPPQYHPPSVQKITRTMSNVATGNQPRLKLDPEVTALILIEYQNEFTSPGGKLHDAVKECMQAKGTLENSKKMMEFARDSGASIVHAPIIFEKGHNEIGQQTFGILSAIKHEELFLAGSWGSEFCNLMKPVHGDHIVKGKSGICAFSSTNLDFYLRQNGIKNVILAGYLTNCCVESTMRNAYEYGYSVYTVPDCCAATSISGHDAAISNTFDMFSTPSNHAEIIEALRSY